MHLEKLKSSLDEITKVSVLALRVFNLVADVHILGLEQVQNGQDLSIVRHKSLTNSVRARHQKLQDLESNGDNIRIAGVKGSLDRDDELRNDREDLGSTVLEHVHDTLNSEESVGIHLFADALEEDRQVMVIIELLDLDLPLDRVFGAVLQRNREVTSIVE